MNLYLNLHHYNILVSCEEEGLLKKIQDEFHFFVVPEQPVIDTHIELTVGPCPEMPSMIAIKILETCSIYKIGSRQFIDYAGKAQTIWDHQEKLIQIYSEDFDRLYEIAFLSIHSVFGQNLEKRGVCRIHAVSFSIADVTTLVMLPPKGGKSTLLSYLLENPEVKIVADDMPLVNLKGEILPFPSKISMDEIPKEGVLSQLEWKEFKRTIYPAKWTTSLSQIKERLAFNPPQDKVLLIAGFRLSRGQSILTPVSKWKMLGPLMEHMITGMGLPQIVEMFLKFNFLDVFKLALHGCIRTICAIQLLRRSRSFYFYMGPDKAYNAQVLLEKNYEEQTH